MSQTDYTSLFQKINNPLRHNEKLTEETYKIYYVDESGNKHGSEKFYRSDVGHYPGGYCWDDLEISRMYEHGSEVSEYNHCNNHKKKSDIYISKEYNKEDDMSTIIYYDFKYNSELHDFFAEKWTEYLHKGHYSTFSKESHTGLVFFWEKTLECGSTLKEKCQFIDGKHYKTLSLYYRNGFIKQDHTLSYNYTFRDFILNGEQEEYFSRDLSGQLSGFSYKYANGFIKEQIEYSDNKKQGFSKFYTIFKDASKLTHDIQYCHDKEIKRTSYSPNIIYNYDITNNVSLITEYKRRYMSDYSKLKEYSISGYYLDISNNIPFNNKYLIKHGSYMEWYCHTDALFLMLRYENGELNGPCRSFYENGTQNVSGHYKNHKKSGIFTYCDQKGNKRYFNHDTGRPLEAIDISEQYKGTTHFDSTAFAYSNFESASSLI